MTELWIWGFIASLILLALGFALKSAQDQSLLKDVEKKLNRASSELETIKNENDKTITGIQQSHATEIQKLAKSVPALPHGQRLEELREKVLLFVSENSHLETHQITGSFRGSEQRALFHLQELEKSNFVISTYVAGSSWGGTEPNVYSWSIGNPGLAYLNEHKLLQ